MDDQKLFGRQANLLVLIIIQIEIPGKGSLEKDTSGK